jgi:hypothetical protein
MKLLRKHLSGILFLIVAEAWGVLVWGHSRKELWLRFWLTLLAFAVVGLKYLFFTE